MTEETTISVLDLSNPGQIDKVKIATELKRATASTGFFYVRFDDAEASIMAAIRREQRSLFELPQIQKTQLAIDQNNRGYLGMGQALMAGAKRHDQKEVFFWGRETAADDLDYLAGVPLCGPNQWPEGLPEFKKAVLDYSNFVHRIGALLLKIIARSLGSEESFFLPYYEKTMLRGQLLRYPPTENHPDQFGVAPHSDFGCITLLLQETPGLEVLFPDGRWVAAPPIENTLVINIGDLLERWSNRRLPSTKHRVRNLSPDARYSIAMFYDPSPMAIVDPQSLLPDEAAEFPPIAAADYILSRNQGAFDHYKTVEKTK